jgi:hypothetical protein
MATLQDFEKSIEGPRRYCTPHLFHYVSIWLGMTLQLCGSEHVTSPWRANTQSRIFSFLVGRRAKLIMADTSSYSIEERLVASVWVQVRRWIGIQQWFWKPSHLPEQLTVREFLSEAFPGQWFGRGSATSRSPVSWPPSSLDLTTCDNSLWGVIKGKVAVRHCNTNAELRAATSDAS